MSWLSLRLDSADRQISGGNARDGIRASAAVAPICQSRGMRAGRPKRPPNNVCPCLLTSSPFHPSLILLSERRHVRKQKSRTFPDFHPPQCCISCWKHARCWHLKGHILAPHYVFYKKWGAKCSGIQASVFNPLPTQWIHNNLHYFLVTEANSDLRRLDVCVVRVAHSLSLSLCLSLYRCCSVRAVG